MEIFTTEIDRDYAYTYKDMSSKIFWEGVNMVTVIPIEHSVSTPSNAAVIWCVIICVWQVDAMKVGVKQFKKEYKGINIDKIDVRNW